VVHFFVDVAKREPMDPCPALSPNDPDAVVAVSAEGDYVTILTMWSVPYTDDPSQSYTTTRFNTWRFIDGKADEHWESATLPTGPATE
jgi:predicted SnoaL-like aldol condensation-catalyzing enzyme